MCIRDRKIIRYFEKLSKLDVSMVSAPLLSLYALAILVIFKVFAFSSWSSSILHLLVPDKSSVCFVDQWIRRNQSEIFKVNQSVFLKMNQSNNCWEMSCFLKRSDEKQSEKGKVKLGSSNFRLPLNIIFKNWPFTY